MPTQTEYKQMLQKARMDLEEALKQRTAWDIKITNLRHAITGLAPLAGESPQTNEDVDIAGTAGITHGIRRVLSRSTPMSAPEIRDALAKKQEFKQKLESYASPLTVIHNTLNRLVRQGDVIQTPSGFTLKEK